MNTHTYLCVKNLQGLDPRQAMKPAEEQPAGKTATTTTTTKHQSCHTLDLYSKVPRNHVLLVRAFPRTSLASAKSLADFLLCGKKQAPIDSFDSKLSRYS